MHIRLVTSLFRASGLSLLPGLLVTLCVSAAGAQTADCPDPGRQPATEKLMSLVQGDPALQEQLTRSIELGQIINSDPNTNPVASLEDYYDFIDALVTYPPQNIDSGIYDGKIRVSMDGTNYCNWNILDILSFSYFLVDRQLTTDPRGQIQFENDAFSNWMRDIAEEWGQYLETPASAVHVPDFTGDPNFGDWYCPPEGGYTTFQDFFTRELCAATFPTGSRPVEGYDDPATVVAIGDSTSAGWWPISGNGKLVTTYDGISQGGEVIKGQLYSDVADFILGKDGETVLETFGAIDPAIFNKGTWTHQFLNVNNYHRLHVPVAGKIVYLKHLQSGVRMKSGWAEARRPEEVDHYDPQDTADWQFGQTRMVIGIETESHGTVVISPMGMAQVSSIVKRDWVTEGAMTDKGWEFANFAFGGSDFVVIFQEDADFVLTAETLPEEAPGAGVAYKTSLQGEKYGCFGGVTTCSATPQTPPAPPSGG
ncbi:MULTISPECIES: phosphatidylserine decarboxylase [unclassified Roseibium]|uniref:phosphatidylserine decarboxylase n=2 Tax=Roseibium TaxID=150830 RepID=UPI0031714FB2